MLTFGNLKPASAMPAGYGLSMGTTTYAKSIDDGDPRRGTFATGASPRAKPSGLGTTVLAPANNSSKPSRPKLTFGASMPSFASLSPFARTDTAPTLTYGPTVKPAPSTFGGLAGLVKGLSMGVPVGQNYANSGGSDGSEIFGSVVQPIPQGNTAQMDASANSITAATDLARSIMGTMLTKTNAPEATPTGGSSAAFGGGVSGGGTASLMTPMNIGIAAAVVVGVVYLASSGGKRKRKR